VTTTRVCRVEDVPLGEGRAVEIDGHRIAVFQTRNGWHALDQRCPHKGGPLTDGIVADGCVTCPLHDRRFDLATGRCHSDDLRVAVYRVEIHDGQVWVDGAAMMPDGAASALAA
jgi:nitrite reductase (NADH) small subunit